MIFGKNKSKGSEPPAFKQEPKQAAEPVKNPSANIDPDDFFKDMGRKPKQQKTAEVREEIESPEIVGLREAPEEIAPSTLADIDIDTVDTDILPDKTLLDDGLYHGTLADIEGTVDTDSLPDYVPRGLSDENPAEAAPGQKNGPLDADDFFKDMGRKKKPDEVKAEIESPEIVGLREAPEEVAPSTLDDIGISEINTDDLPDKTLLDDGHYHGTLESV